MSTTLYFKRIDPRAQLPQQRKGDVGLDVRCLDDFEIPPGKTIKIRTGLAFARTPDSSLGPLFFKVEDRSSMALKGVFSHGGIIDTSSYRGEFHVILYNSSDVTYIGKADDKVAQGVVYLAAFNDSWSTLTCEEVDEVEQTTRGIDGFGSTGR